MHLPWIYCPDTPLGERFAVTGREAVHLARVLRAGPGYRFIAFDGAGSGWEAEVLTAGDRRVEAAVVREAPAEQPAVVEVTVAVGVVKGARMDWAVEKAAETGAVRFIPLLTEFGVIKPGSGRLERWRGLAVAAAKQSHRLRVMGVEEPVKLTDLLTESALHGDVWALHPGEDALSLTVAAEQLSTPARLLLLIGPEGGFSTAELALFREKGIGLVSLGNRPLRTETAVAVAVGAVTALAGAA